MRDFIYMAVRTKTSNVNMVSIITIYTSICLENILRVCVCLMRVWVVCVISVCGLCVCLMCAVGCVCGWVVCVLCVFRCVGGGYVCVSHVCCVCVGVCLLNVVRDAFGCFRSFPTVRHHTAY